jgi:hypothetical protein
MSAHGDPIRLQSRMRLITHRSFLNSENRCPFTLMTTSHQDETLEDALWFAFYCARHSDELHRELGTVVVIVDSDVLEGTCAAWVTDNRE